MTLRKRVLRLTIAATIVAAAALLAAQSKADVTMRAATEQETVKGDLAGAIRLYEQVVKEAGPDRALAARALLRMARCYERLGNDQARSTYERLVREYADQKEAAEARARLATGDVTGARSQPHGVSRTVLVNNGAANVEFPAISADGRYLAFTDYVNANGNLVIRDLVANLDRQVTTEAQAPLKEVWEKAFSRDGRSIAYTFFPTGELRVVDLTASTPAPRSLFNPARGFTYVVPYDWSSDATKIAVQAVRGHEFSRIGYVTVGDGFFHPLRTLDWQGSTRLSLSPDGAYLAYDRRSAENGDVDVHVVSLNGQQDVAIAQHTGRDAVVGWSVDGRYLLFTSEAERANGLWAQAMRAGRPSGAAILLEPNVSPSPIGVTSTGDVFFDVDPSTVGIYVGSIDLRAGRVGASLSGPIHGERPAWSPDGSALAYANPGATRQRNVLSIRTVATGRTRDLPLNDLQYVNNFIWTPDGRSIVGKGWDKQGRPGFFKIDVQTAAVSTVALQPDHELFNQPMTWIGGSLMAYVRLSTNSPGRLPGIRTPGPDAPKLIERDVSTGAERELFDFSAEPWATYGMSVSPNARFVAGRSPGRGETPVVGGPYQSDRTSFVVLYNLATGSSRRIWTVPFAPAFSGSIEWLPDSSAVVVMQMLEPRAGQREAWLVPVDGGKPRRLDLGVQNILSDGLRIAPDGRTVAIMAGDRRNREVQVLEHIVPAHSMQ